MKYLLTLVLTAILVLPGLNGQSQSKKETYTDYDRGYYLWYNDKWDSAYTMFNSYLEHPDDSLKKASAYKFMGEIQWYFGDLFSAQENLISALKTLDTSKQEHHEELGKVYNILGNISLDLKSYSNALQFFDQGITFTSRSPVTYELLNGKAIALRNNGNYDGAVAIYNAMLAMQSSDQSQVARIIDNRANALWLQNPAYPALPAYRTALKIRLDSQYYEGLVASYKHLSEYYTNSSPDSAEWYADKMYKQAAQLQNIDNMIEAADKLVIFSRSPALKVHWHQQYKVLADSLQLSRDTARNRYGLVKYKVQKVEAKYAVLENYVSIQQIIIFTISLLAVVIIVSLILLYRRRRKRIKDEAEKRIQDSKLKTSQKVHDVVANELYGIMNELEHSEEIEKEPLLNRIEELYERSRDISYEDADSTGGEDYDMQLHSLLNSFSSERTNVYVVGNQPEFWQRITGFQKSELLLVLRELMTNMKKHSGASSVIVRFAQENNTGCINYSDNGKGFPADITRGNGLSNTDNRIKSMNGTIIFGKSEQGGAAVAIRFPLEPYTL